MRICTNFPRFPAVWSASTGEAGTAQQVLSVRDAIRQSDSCDCFLINGDIRLVLGLCVYFGVFFWHRRPIIAVDLVLCQPRSLQERAKALLKRFLLKGVAHFINYFKSSDGYSHFFGITPERSSFVHFKPNLRHRYTPRSAVDGEYVLCFGKSRRDYDTFIRAVSQLPFPAAIPRPNVNELRRHGSKFTYGLADLPQHVLVLDDDGSEASMVRILEHAKVVVIPMLSSNLVAGIGVYLNAMLLRKCVVITEGAGATDVLSDEALFVRTEDPRALAAVIHRAWTDDVLRRVTADTGYRHAISLGGEPELYQRVVDKVVAWFRAAKPWLLHH
jgi:hypothetical protein